MNLHKNWLRLVIESARPHQWLKNLFIFIPLVFGRKLLDFPSNIYVLICFTLFCFITGSVYILNDVFDIERDRMHAEKQSRPIARGDLPVRQALASAFFIICAVLIYQACFFRHMLLLTLIYVVINLIYSRFLKHIILVDVFCLGLFFMIRIFLGSVTANVTPSRWLLIMIFLLSIFLGFGKRRQDLMHKNLPADPSNPNDSLYEKYLLDQITAVITPSIAVVYMLYSVDIRTISFIGSDNLLFTVPFVYFGLFRYLYLIHVKKIGSNPTLALTQDKPLRYSVLLWLIACTFIIYA